MVLPPWLELSLLRMAAGGVPRRLQLLSFLPELLLLFKILLWIPLTF